MSRSSKVVYLEEPFAPTKLINEAHDMVAKKAKEKKRNLLYLIFQYLKDEGYHETASALQDETQLSAHFCVCDNIDLATVLQEYETYYFMRYQKYPKVCRQQVVVQDGDASRGMDRTSKSAAKHKHKRASNSQQNKSKSDETRNPAISQPLLGSDFVSGQSVFYKDAAFQEALPAHINSSPEMLELADIISKEIVTTKLNTKWDDVIGLDNVKAVLRETIVYPLKYPSLFQGLLAPWRAVLLYGPPGTGKTMLAKAVASECRTTFFNISSSSIVSKWRGESEKLVRVLFEVAQYYAPSTIFIDEIDSIACRPGTEDHEGSRRLRAELLVHLDGLSSKPRDNVFLLATTNSPWNLDQALLRRLEKRILVDVPNIQDRENLVKHLLPATLPHKHDSLAVTCSIDYKHIAQITEGYTGSDLKVACKEAAMNSVRQIIKSMEAGATVSDPVRCGRQSRVKPVLTGDLEEALKRTRPTTLGLLNKYHAWERELGST